MFEIKNLTKTYKKSNTPAIENINISIDDGDIFGFIGPNGAGKSTTIKAAVGIHSFDSGSITLDGLSVTDNAIEYKSKIAYIPDNPDLYEHLTGIEYINFIAEIFKIGEEKNDLIHKYATMFNIEENLADPIKTYSHGMKQKIALIAAFIHKPRLLILDEPFVGLDPKASHDLKEVMMELCKEGTMIFFSSHVLEVVEKFCNKIAIIKDGRIVASGNTDEVKGDDTLEDKFLELFE